MTAIGETTVKYPEKRCILATLIKKTLNTAFGIYKMNMAKIFFDSATEETFSKVINKNYSKLIQNNIKM